VNRSVGRGSDNAEGCVECRCIFVTAALVLDDGRFVLGVVIVASRQTGKNSHI
jgi:hypothetical protein